MEYLHAPTHLHNHLMGWLLHPQVYVYDDWSGAAHEVHVDNDDIQAPQGAFGTIDIGMEEQGATWPGMMQHMEDAVHEDGVADIGNNSNDAAAEENSAESVLNSGT